MIRASARFAKRRVFLWGFGATLVACVAGTCFSSPLSAADMRPPGDLRFGARIDVAPLSSRRGDVWTGYTIDLCQRIFLQYQDDYRKIQGFPEIDPSAETVKSPQFVAVSAADRIDALADGRIDILCGATTVTIERMARINFSLFTFVSGASVMKRVEKDSGLLKQSQMEPENVRVVFVGATTTEQRIFERFGSSVQRIRKDNHTEAFQALERGEADFYFGDRVILAQKLAGAENPKQYQLAPGFLSVEPYAIAIAKDNEALLQAANSALARLYRSREIEQIYRNHFPTQKMSDMLRALYRLQSLPE